MGSWYALWLPTDEEGAIRCRERWLTQNSATTVQITHTPHMFSAHPKSVNTLQAWPVSLNLFCSKRADLQACAPSLSSITGWEISRIPPRSPLAAGEGSRTEATVIRVCANHQSFLLCGSPCHLTGKHTCRSTKWCSQQATSHLTFSIAVTLGKKQGDSSLPVLRPLLLKISQLKLILIVIS